MRHKAKVIRYFPSARLETETIWSVDGSPRRRVVKAGGLTLCIHPNDTEQGATAAWRSAYYWCMRNSEHPNVAAVRTGAPSRALY
jgi:hypothetical protein